MSLIIFGSLETLISEPLPFNMLVKVDVREEVFLQMVIHPPRFPLVSKIGCKSFLWLQIVDELRQ